MKIYDKSDAEELDAIVTDAKEHWARGGRGGPTRLWVYQANHIPAAERLWHVLLSLILLAYGTHGLMTGRIYVPGKRTNGMYFYGEAMWILYGAMLCAVVNLLAVVVDHYDQRDNEFRYKMLSRVTQLIGWSLFVVAIVLNIVTNGDMAVA